MKALKITTLEIWRKRRDLIEFYIILYSVIFCIVNGKIIENDLPVEVKEAKSLNGFKAGKDGQGLILSIL